MSDDIYKAESLANKRFWSGLKFGEIWGTKSRLNLPRGEVGRSERKHLLFPGAGYGTRNLIPVASRRWLRTRKQMNGRHREG
jgi:hypothetical protein